MKHLLLILLLPVFCYGQGDQTIIKVPISSTGSTEQAILHLPDDYGSTSTQYPVMIFLQGMGESGPNPASIYNSASAGGPAYFITNKLFPSSFVNPADKKSYKYIVVSPQCPDLNSTTAPGQLDYVITYLLKTYRIDASRIYLTGLSMGGGSILQYVGGVDANGVKVNATHKIAAIIPMSAVMNAYYRPTMAAAIVANNVRIWGFGSPTDVHGANTLNLVTWDINTEIKANYGVSTAYSGGHCCWGQFYDPTFTQSGMSIYQWALQYTTGSTPATSVPTANAGSNQSITLPTSQVTLSGAASTVSGGTISKYAWSQQSGPSTAAIAAAGSVSTSVTGLVAGTYVFKLTITDNNGKTASATVQITVNAALTTPPVSAGLAIPGKIEADGYSTMSGVATQATADAGGGLNVGWIDPRDWMDYKVNVATAGTYTVSFRVATPYSSTGLQLKSASGAVLATANFTVTGGFQSWKTVSTTVTLPAGAQTLRVYASGANAWNFNWMQFVSGTSSSAIQATAESVTSSEKLVTDTTAATSKTAASFVLYPNPVQGQFTIQLNNEYMGNMQVQIVDITGVVRQVYSYNKSQSSMQLNLSAGNLSAGTYFVKVQMGAWSEVKKIVKI